jgi:hypothetical protein
LVLVLDQTEPKNTTKNAQTKNEERFNEELSNNKVGLSPAIQYPIVEFQHALRNPGPLVQSRERGAWGGKCKGAKPQNPAVSRR